MKLFCMLFGFLSCSLICCLMRNFLFELRLLDVALLDVGMGVAENMFQVC